MGRVALCAGLLVLVGLAGCSAEAPDFTAGATGGCSGHHGFGGDNPMGVSVFCQGPGTFDDRITQCRAADEARLEVVNIGNTDGSRGSGGAQVTVQGPSGKVLDRQTLEPTTRGATEEPVATVEKVRGSATYWLHVEHSFNEGYYLTVALDCDPGNE